MEKQLYHQLNHQGYYIFSFYPDESPREPGVFLIPAGCVPDPLPEYDAQKHIPYYSNGWNLIPIVQPKKKSWFRRMLDKVRA